MVWASSGVFPTFIAVLYASSYALLAAPPADSAMSEITPVDSFAVVPIAVAIFIPKFAAVSVALTPTPTAPPNKYGAICCIPSTPRYSATNSTGAWVNPLYIAASVPPTPLPSPIMAFTSPMAFWYSAVVPAFPTASNALANLTNELSFGAAPANIATEPTDSKNPPPAFIKLAVVFMIVELPVSLAISIIFCAPARVGLLTYCSHTLGSWEYTTNLSASVTRGAVITISSGIAPYSPVSGFHILGAVAVSGTTQAWSPLIVTTCCAVPDLNAIASASFIPAGTANSFSGGLFHAP